MEDYYRGTSLSLPHEHLRTPAVPFRTFFGTDTTLTCSPRTLTCSFRTSAQPLLLLVNGSSVIYNKTNVPQHLHYLFQLLNQRQHARVKETLYRQLSVVFALILWKVELMQTTR